MAFTVDHNDKSENSYQGIVELKGDSLVEAVEHYFTQSEQIKTSFMLAVHPQDNYWRAGGIMIQHKPDSAANEDEIEGNIEDWKRSAMLLSTCSDGEILSPVLNSADVLYRLFHEEGVRVYSPTHIHFKCRCTQEKVIEIIRNIPRDELEAVYKKEGKVSLKCEFCSEEYSFDLAGLDNIYKGD